jgi:hypothetical protein
VARGACDCWSLSLKKERTGEIFEKEVLKPKEIYLWGSEKITMLDALQFPLEFR